MDVFGDLKWENKTILEIDKLKILQDIEFENITDDYLYRLYDSKKKLIELETIIYKILNETEND